MQMTQLRMANGIHICCSTCPLIRRPERTNIKQMRRVAQLLLTDGLMSLNTLIIKEGSASLQESNGIKAKAEAGFSLLSLLTLPEVSSFIDQIRDGRITLFPSSPKPHHSRKCCLYVCNNCSKRVLSFSRGGGAFLGTSKTASIKIITKIVRKEIFKRKNNKQLLQYQAGK